METMDTKKYDHACTQEHAAKFLEWIRARGGIAVWRSMNLADPGASWSTPALDIDGKPTGQPTWQADSTPEAIHTDPERIEVLVPREVRRFHVAVRPGSQGMSFKCTVASSRRIRKAVERAGKGAWQEFDYGTQEAVIYVSGESCSLAGWERRQAVKAIPVL